MIRYVDPARDAPAIAALYNAYVRDTIATFEEVPVQVDEMEARIRSILQSGYPYIVWDEALNGDEGQDRHGVTTGEDSIDFAVALPKESSKNDEAVEGRCEGASCRRNTSTTCCCGGGCGNNGNQPLEKGPSKVVGFAYASAFRSRVAYRFSSETSVYLSTESRGKGIGSKLYRRLLDEMAIRDLHLAIAVISLPNDASCAMHKRFGFEEVGCFREVGRKFGRWIDVVFMQKTLTPSSSTTDEDRLQSTS